MKSLPKLSILALCYNHAAFLEEALSSIAQLSYPNLEVLVIDDASTDGSVGILQKWQELQPAWSFFFQDQNQGNCKSFNRLLEISTGDYVLDFATDDVLISDQVQHWMAHFDAHPEAGFCYADAWIFGKGISKDTRFSTQQKFQSFPVGHILKSLFAPNFICPPAVLFRKSALERVEGYDENLAYEDWDIWLRLARVFPVCRFDQPVLHYRKHIDSMSASILRHRNEKHLQSTIQILHRILVWPEFKNESDLMVPFVQYHLKLASFLQLPVQANSLYEILKSRGRNGFISRFYLWISRFPLPLHYLFRWIKR